MNERLQMNLQISAGKHTMRGKPRRGATLVLAAILLAIVFAMVAFAVDLGYLMVAQTDLQRTADAAAHAAVLEYRSDKRPSSKFNKVRLFAQRYTRDNKILRESARIDANQGNANTNGDVVIGRIDFERPRSEMTFGNYDDYNAVRVRVRRTADSNGEVPMFFARIFGIESAALEAKATAAIIQNVGGFKIPSSGENVPFLPLTIRVDFWESNLADGVDDYAIDVLNESITEEADDISEVVLFPNRTESSGNFGTLNVGISANSTSYVSHQIRNGLSQSDLDYHGGDLSLDGNGELPLSGSPGLGAAIKDDLQAIAGKPVIIPLYREVSGNGNGAQFVIVKFVAVRVMAVNLNGGEKFVAVQPANLTFKGSLQAPSGTGDSSDGIYSPPVIVQ
jgi:Flp pilus assembly protein TadG